MAREEETEGLAQSAGKLYPSLSDSAMGRRNGGGVGHLYRALEAGEACVSRHPQLLHRRDEGISP